MQQQVPTHAFHVMVKPSGSDCNLNCDYCFYLEKQSLYHEKPVTHVDDDTLGTYVRHYIAISGTQNEVAFTWQGDEPTLLGLDSYRRAVALQAKYGAGRKISNSSQASGVLFGDEWCAFLAGDYFLVGLSLDGPAEIHNQCRVTKGGRSARKLVMCALMLLQKHHVDYNVLVCVNRTSVLQSLQVYDFPCDAGVELVQLIPVVERLADETVAHAGLKLHAPGDIWGELTEWPVCPQEFGEFLAAILDHWIKRDVGKVLVVNIEWAFANFVGVPGAVCHHQLTCGRSVIVEHNGDVYTCDHYVHLQYRPGNMLQQTIAEMIDSPQQQAFGEDKFKWLPAQCHSCNALKACWRGCPKHRFMLDASGKPGLNYLCAGYQRYFRHLPPYLKAMADLLAYGHPANDIMQAHLMVVSKQKPAAACGQLPDAA